MSERHLLTAVRDEIRDALSLRDEQCDVQLNDSDIPTYSGDVYVMVLPATVTRGDGHAGGSVVDKRYSVPVVVVKRLVNTPRDRGRKLYNERDDSLINYVESVENAIDFSYDVLETANALILSEDESSEGFIEPLQFANRQPPQIVSGLDFGDRNEKRAGLKQRITFTDARRVQTR